MVIGATDLSLMHLSADYTDEQGKNLAIGVICALYLNCYIF
jgi:hypothetical protein